jgi:hemerythrin-like metal-binding protein
MYFIWEKIYETGVEKIDFQHKKIVEYINRLYTDIVINKNTDSINETLMDLKIYTISHFSVEEKLFKKHKYSGDDLEEHLKKHSDFENTLSSYIGDITSSKNELGYNIIEFLKDWLINHVMETDMKFVQFINSKIQ